MAQMNKQDANHARVTELEEDLIAGADDRENEIDTGRPKRQQNTKEKRTLRNANRRFSIQQGVRRRHPNRVLHDFVVQAGSTSHAESVWEQALAEENERQNIGKIYKVQGEVSLLATQMGITQTAENNHRNSQPKLSRQHLVGV